MYRAWLFSIVLILLGLAMPAAQAEKLSIVGTGDGLELLKALGARFEKNNPDVQIAVPSSIGSGGAIAAVGAGRERIGRIARPLTQVEETSGLVAVPLFDIPAVFYVHPGVGPRALNGAQLRAIFDGSLTNWASVGGPNLRVRVVRREESDSVLMTLRSSLPEFGNVEITQRSKIALTTQEAISSIRDNEGAIGFAPYSTGVAQQLPVVALGGIAPTDKRYPVKVRVSLLLKEGPQPASIAAFTTFLKGTEARDIMLEFGALPVEP